MSKSKSGIFGPSHGGCQQKAQVPRTASVGGTDPHVADLSLCGKPSFLVCRGRKSPGLTEVGSLTDLRQPHSPNLQHTALKVQGIMKHQQNIIELVDDSNRNMADRRGSRTGDDYES
ncbi:uncharacterized protein LOC108030798 [Drosophila biarmipes]|uniref:uncharacterized protein LOC108030798 n=1 Tax=Drosophila biarmipes TaxID=125945 RepID=UPI0007E5D627|nr:uncharacterized protein LOC108030798 [Drosophila biarmipes]